MNGEKYFIDTNIFVYAFDSRNPAKQKKANAIINNALTSQKGIVSYQVVQEFLNVATRKFAVPLTIADAQIYLSAVLEPLCEIHSSPAMYHQALEIVNRWQYSFYDSLIIAAAHSSACKILFSEDLQHGQKIHETTILNPFL